MAQSVLGSLAEGTALQGTASGAQHQPDFSLLSRNWFRSRN
jgi:hypothetical protein